MNLITICGLVAINPEVRETKDNKKICTFKVAVKRNNEKTDFFKVIAFGDRAELCNKWLKKGSKCIIVGAMWNEQFEAKDGSKRDGWQIALRDIEFLAKLRKNKDGKVIDDDYIPQMPKSQNEAMSGIFGNCANLPF